MKRLSLFVALACLGLAVPMYAEDSVAATEMTPTWTAPAAPTLPSATLEDKGQYYLYNIEAKMFLTEVTPNVSGGWGSEAGFASTGALATLTWTTEATDEAAQANLPGYVITTNYGTLFFNESFLYMDGSANSTGNSEADHWAERFFTFEQQADGSYTIQNNARTDNLTETADYVGYDANATDNNTVIDNLTADDTGIYWLLVTADKLDDLTSDLEQYDTDLAYWNENSETVESTDRTFLNNALTDALALGLDQEDAFTEGVTVYEDAASTQKQIDSATEALAKLIQQNGTASGELVVYGGKEYKKTGINLIPNPDFSYGYVCWTHEDSNNELQAIDSSNFSVKADDDWGYILTAVTGGGTGEDGCLVTAWSIEADKTYYISCYTKNVNGNATFDVNSQANSQTGTDGLKKDMVDINYTSGEWVKTEYVFSPADVNSGYETATNVYALLRAAWLDTTNSASFANFELCEVELMEEENVDETSVIVNPKFELTNADGNYDAQGWTTTTDENGNAQFSIGPDATYTNGDANVTYPFFEAYGGSTSTPISDRSFYQTIKLEAGEYRLTVDAIATQQAEAFDNVGGVYVYAGDQQTPVYTANNVPETFSVDFAVEAEEGETADVEIGVKLVSCDANWVAFDNFTLTYFGDEKVYDLATLTELIAEATELYGEGEGTGADDLQAAIEAAQAVLYNSESDNETLESAISSLKEAMEVYKLQNEQADILGEWVGYTGTFSDIVLEFYREDDTTAHTTAVGTVMTQTITELPAGTYEVQLYFAANYANYGTSDPAGGTQDETEAVSIGANGVELPLTFGTKSASDYASLDAIPVVTLSNVVVDESGTISLSINVTAEQCVNWFLVGTKSVTYVSSDVPTYEDLQEAIEAAEALVANVGDAAFQIPTENAEELLSAIETVSEVTEEATASQIAAALSVLNSAAEEFEEGFATFVLNTPAEGQTFNIIMETESTGVAGNAVEFLLDETNAQGGYDFQFTAEPNAILAGQVFTFTPDEAYDGVNGYKVSFVDAEGTTHYLCTGNPYGAATGEYGIRATGGQYNGTDVTDDDALTIQVMATTTEGVWQLLNTKVTDGYLGINPDGDDTHSLYTNDKDTYCDLSLAEASSTIEWSLTADYGTLVLPFAPTEDEANGLTFYSTEAYDSESDTGVALQLEEVETPEAGVPYIVGGEQGTYTFAVTAGIYGDYDSTEKTVTYSAPTAGWLTGAYVSTSVPTGSYVLQNGDDGLAFYAVSDDDPITISPNHCYLTVSAEEGETNAPAVIFFPNGNGTPTAITSVEANVADAEAVYDLSGRKVSQAQKGIYIKGGKKVVIK